MAVELNSKAQRTIDRFMNNLDKYDMSMDIQRSAGQWNRKQESALVESVLKDYPIPNLYALENEDKTWSIIDGKQRLSTFIRFMNNEFALSKDLQPVEVDGEIVELAGKKFSDLSEKAQSKFRGYVIPIVGITGADENDKREIFARLNNGANLTPAQKRTVEIGDELLKLLRSSLNSNVTKVKSVLIEEKKKRGRKPKNQAEVKSGPVYKDEEVQFYFWRDITGLGEAARKSSADRDVVFQTLMLMDGKEYLSFKNKGINNFVIELQKDEEHMAELFNRLDQATAKITNNFTDREVFAKTQKKNFKKTVIPFAIAELDRLSKSKQGTGKYLDALYTFLTTYNTPDEEQGVYKDFKDAILQGTGTSDSIEKRKQFFKNLTK